MPSDAGDTSRTQQDSNGMGAKSHDYRWTLK